MLLSPWGIGQPLTPRLAINILISTEIKSYTPNFAQTDTPSMHASDLVFLVTGLIHQDLLICPQRWVELALLWTLVSVFVAGLLEGEHHGRGNFSSPAELHHRMRITCQHWMLWNSLALAGLPGMKHSFTHVWFWACSVWQLMLTPFMCSATIWIAFWSVCPLKKSKKQNTKYWLLLPTKLQETKSSRMNTENVL